MGITPNLKLTTISEQDNPKVKDFFQDLAGDVTTSNMQKIDEAVKKIQDVANAAIASSEKGKAGGVATLGSDKKVVKKQLPDLNYLPDTSTLEDIPDGTTRKAVTQAEKNTWNKKSNFSGSYNDLTDKPNLDFIPTSAKGATGGVAPLGEDKKVPGIYLPAPILDPLPVSNGGTGATSRSGACSKLKAFSLEGGPSVGISTLDHTEPGQYVVTINNISELPDGPYGNPSGMLTVIKHAFFSVQFLFLNEDAGYKHVIERIYVRSIPTVGGYRFSSIPWTKIHEADLHAL